MITVRTDEKDLIESKTFISIGLGETIVSLNSENESLNFIFDFYEEKDAEQGAEFELIDDSNLRIKLTNYANPLGSTWMEPAQVGNFKNRKLYLLPYIKKAGSSGNLREVLVCFYLGDEEINDGKV